MTTGTPTPEYLRHLESRRDVLRDQAKSFLMEKRAAGIDELSGPDDTKFRAMLADVEDLNSYVELYRSELARAGVDNPLLNRLSVGSQGTALRGHQWGVQVAEKLRRSMSHDGSESRAVVSGSIDIPSLVEPEIVAIARPNRLVDLLVNRRAATGYAIEYFRQIVRTTNADVVPDNALKPTSVYTVEGVTDHVRVLAHLSEPTPIRLWDDHANLQSWLTSEMFNGLADALEEQVIAGDSTGENFTGLLEVDGTTQVPFATDVPTTLRSAVSALQIIGEQPNAWVMNPVDAAEVDLARWGTAGGWLSEGFGGGGGAGGSNNIFGDVTQRVISNSVPAGTAVLADWSQVLLFVREDANLAIDASGVLFTKNQFVARAEMRAVSAVLRPSAVAIVDLTAA